MGRIADATFGRVFAFGYDWFLGMSERAGLAERRRELLSAAHGRTIEVGAGTGLNLAHYPTGPELVLAEPNGHMAARLRARVEHSLRIAQVVQAPGERLPFPDASFDTAVMTLVLCTAPDPEVVLADVARVLRPGGQLLFLEHVRSSEPRLARWQDRLHGPWKLFAGGCHCNRLTLETIEASAFEVESVERTEVPMAVPLVRPMVIGIARSGRLTQPDSNSSSAALTSPSGRRPAPGTSSTSLSPASRTWGAASALSRTSTGAAIARSSRRVTGQLVRAA